MIWVDYAIIAILVLSAGISVLRGFLKEAISLLGWVLAFWLALTFADDISGLFASTISQPSMRHGLAFFAILIGTPRDILPHNPWLVCIGLFLIYTGFWGFYVACNVPLATTGYIDGLITGATQTGTTIYLTPTTLSAITVNFLMSLSGGMLVGYMMSKGDAFWTYSGGLAGIIAASAGNDLYHPIQALIIGGIGTAFMYKLHFWVERRFKIDDAVGAVAVHGYAGFFGVVIAGFVLWGHPSSPYDGFAAITPWGQFAGAMIMFWLLGFIPAWILAKILASMDLLRIPKEIELLGLDFHSNQEAEQARQDVAAAVRAEHA